MTKLTDTQLVILAAAAKRSSGSLLPLPKRLKLGDGNKTAALKNLIKRKLAVEQLAAAEEALWREENGERFALVIGPEGLRAIGAEPSGAGSAGEQPPGTGSTGSNVKRQKRVSQKGKTSKRSNSLKTQSRPGTKQAKLIERLRQAHGASIADLVKVTGWRAHSVRGVMSGVLKKKLGLSISSEKDASGERRYRLAE